MGKKAEDRPESIKVRVITPEGRYQTLEVTRTDLKKSLAAEVLAETGSLDEAGRKSGIPLWGIKSWLRDSQSFKKMYQWSLEQRSWRKRTKEWLRNQGAELRMLATQMLDKLSRIWWRCFNGLYWRLSSLFGTKVLHMSSKEVYRKNKDEIDELMRIVTEGRAARRDPTEAKPPPRLH